jgi:hypothetical protein
MDCSVRLGEGNGCGLHRPCSGLGGVGFFKPVGRRIGLVVDGSLFRPDGRGCVRESEGRNDGLHFAGGII